METTLAIPGLEIPPSTGDITRPIMRWHGGKWKLAPWVIEHLPAHRAYVEPFAGAASVLLRKKPSQVEVLNDAYGRAVNVFRVLRDTSLASRLAESLALTPYSFEEYQLAYTQSDDPVEDARRMIILGYQGHGSTAAAGGKRSGWRRSIPDEYSSAARQWEALWEQTEHWGNRLRKVFLEHDDAIAVIRRWDKPDTLFYVDPPYLGERAEGRRRGYAHEMEDADHEHLAKTLNECAGSVVISGYNTPLYEKLFHGWKRIEREHMADANCRRTECLWLKSARS